MQNAIQDAIGEVSLALSKANGVGFYELLLIQQDLIRVRTKLEAGEYRTQAYRMSVEVEMSKLKQSAWSRIEEGGK